MFDKCDYGLVYEQNKPLIINEVFDKFRLKSESNDGYLNNNLPNIFCYNTNDIFESQEVIKFLPLFILDTSSNYAILGYQTYFNSQEEIDQRFKPEISTVLGTGSVSPVEMASAFATFGNQ